MRKFRFYTALVIRVLGAILAFPTAFFLTLSDFIKNDDDIFNF